MLGFYEKINTESLPCLYNLLSLFAFHFFLINLNCALQALFLLVGVIFSFLLVREQDAPNAVATSSIVGGVISLIIAELGC